MKKEDAIHILTAMKKSYMALGIPDPEAVGALEIAIKAIQTDNSEKVYQKAFEDIRAELYKERSNISFKLSEEKAKWTNSGIYDGLVWAEEIIDKHNPDNVGTEGKE